MQQDTNSTETKRKENLRHAGHEAVLPKPAEKVSYAEITENHKQKVKPDELGIYKSR